MLILSRKENESIFIGNDIEVKVVNISKGLVKLGFNAPKEMQILRSELVKAVTDANINSSKQSDDVLDALKGLSKKFT